MNTSYHCGKEQQLFELWHVWQRSEPVGAPLDIYFATCRACYKCSVKLPIKKSTILRIKKGY